MPGPALPLCFASSVEEDGFLEVSSNFLLPCWASNRFATATTPSPLKPHRLMRALVTNQAAWGQINQRRTKSLRYRNPNFLQFHLHQLSKKAWSIWLNKNHPTPPHTHKNKVSIQNNEVYKTRYAIRIYEHKIRCTFLPFWQSKDTRLWITLLRNRGYRADLYKAKA